MSQVEIIKATNIRIELNGYSETTLTAVVIFGDLNGRIFCTINLSAANYMRFIDLFNPFLNKQRFISADLYFKNDALYKVEMMIEKC